MSPKLLRYRMTWWWGVLFKVFCSLSNAEIPKTVKLGKNVKFPHGVKGIILNPNTIVEDDVTIFHQVTCGNGNLNGITRVGNIKGFEGIHLKRGCTLSVGAKIICNRGKLTVGENTVIGANAVLTKSTGDNEVWVGVPARCIYKLE